MRPTSLLLSTLRGLALGGALLCTGAATAAERWAAHADTVFTHPPAPPAAVPTAIVQDAAGFIWIGTQSGLHRWDGYRFRAHAAEPDTPGALQDGSIKVLHVDPAGRMWAGTSAGGLARHDAGTDRFDTWPAGPGGLSHVSVFALCDDGSGGLWVGTGAGLDHVDPATRQVRPRVFAAGPGVPVHAVLRDRAGGLWVGTGRGLFHRPAQAQAFAAVPIPIAGQGAPIVTRLLQDGGGRIWVGTRPYGAFVIEHPQAAPQPLQDLLQDPGDAGGSGPQALPHDGILAMAQVGDEVWFGTDGGGMLRVDAASRRVVPVRHQPQVPSSLPDDDVFVIYPARGGGVWVGTDTGLSLHDPGQRALVTWYGGKPDGAISHRNVPSLLPQPDGTVWLGLGDGGVDIVDPLAGRVAQLRPDPRRPLTALPRGRVLAMAAGPDGQVYLGTQQGLYAADPRTRHVVRVVVPGRDPIAAVWALAADGERLWAGGLDGLWGLERPAADPGAGWQVVARHDAGALGDARVSALQRLGGDLWIGTQSGLLRLDLTGGHVERPGPNGPGAQPGGYISSLLPDPQGRLWVASMRSGIWVLPPRHPGADAPAALRRIGTAQGLPHLAVNALAHARDGSVWASTDDGFARIDPETWAVTAWRGADGAGIPTAWSGAGATTAEGEILFGGEGGLTIVQPAHAAAPAAPAPLAITELRVGTRRLDGAERPGLGRAVTLPPGQHTLLVEFAALDYAAPERNRYSYRLVGFDSDWVPSAASRRLASYTNLPPGNYTLELRGSNRAGQWSGPLRLPVQVTPAWHETGWFRTLAGLALAGGVAALVQARTLALRRRERLLHALVDERTAELQRSQARLEQMAYFDSLTGLANRRLFNEDMRRLVALAQRGDHAFTLLLIDLDRFKQVNDSHGHAAGDALLAAVGQRLQQAVRDADRVARLGGDEFAVLLPATAEPAAVDATCRRIAELVAQPVDVPGAAALQTSASIGIARCPADAQSADALYQAADQALYAAKDAGRNQWRWWVAPP